jgi:hypothetical protein
MVAAVVRRQGKEPTATLTASLFDLDQFARHRGSHRFRMRCERKPEVFGAFQQILACIHRLQGPWRLCEFSWMMLNETI